MGSVSQQGRGSPLYALGSVISYAFFFLVEFSFYKGHENLFKRLLLLWKNKSGNVSRTLSPHSKFLPSFLPSLSLWSFLSPRLLICRAIPDFFFLSRTVSILLSFPGIISSPAPVYETISTHWFRSFPSRYALRFLLPIQTSLEAPSEQALCAAFGTSHPSLFPAHERNSLWENHP